MEENNVPARPDFPMTPGGQVLGMAYDAHVAYQSTYDALFGTTSAKLKDFIASLEVTPINDSEVVEDIVELGKYGDDPNLVLSVLRWAEQLVKETRENLSGCYYGTKRSTNNVDTTDITQLRANVDNYLTVALGMVDVGLLTASDIWAVIPSADRKVRNGAPGQTRKVYGGDSLPQSRTVSPIRANSSFLRLEIRDTEDHDMWHTVQADTFKSAVLSGLHLTMSEIRDIVGDFVEACYGTPYEHEDTTFRIVKVKADK